jgi:hypothetical protein
LRLTLAVAIICAAFAGCGGDGDDPTGPDTTSAPTRASTTTSTTNSGNDASAPASPAADEAVRTGAEAVLTSSDPAEACGKYVTDHYLTVAYGGRQGCIDAQAPGSVAEKLDFKDLRIAGNHAKVVVVPSGGLYDGERVTVSLVRQGPYWAVDVLDANVPVGP